MDGHLEEYLETFTRFQRLWLNLLTTFFWLAADRSQSFAEVRTAVLMEMSQEDPAYYQLVTSIQSGKKGAA